MGLSYFQPKIA